MSSLTEAVYMKYWKSQSYITILCVTYLQPIEYYSFESHFAIYE